MQSNSRNGLLHAMRCAGPQGRPARVVRYPIARIFTHTCTRNMSQLDRKWTCAVQAMPDDSGDCFIHLPDPLLAELGWQTNDLISYQLQHDGSFVLKKVSTVGKYPDSELLIILAMLSRQVQQIVQDSVNPQVFDSGKWLVDWIQKPHSALAGKRPLDCLSTASGVAAVSKILGAMQSGAYL